MINDLFAIRLLVAGLFALALLCPAIGQDADKDVSWRAQQEIARRGNLVERVNGFQNAGDDEKALIGEMLAPPADDSNKWHITLVVTKGCKYCEQLRGDINSSTQWQAWVNPKDYTKSWALFEEVQIDDKSQEWRWKEFRPRTFPCVILQPPVDHSFGDPHTIVFAKEGYAKPEVMLGSMRAAIDKYAKKIQPVRAAMIAKAAELAKAKAEATGGIRGGSDNADHQAEANHEGGAGQQTGGWTPPVTPPSPLGPAPYAPQPAGPQQFPPPGADPTQGASPELVILQLISSFFPDAKTILQLIIAISNVWLLYREYAKMKGIPMLVDDATVQLFVNELAKFKESGQQSTASASSPAASRNV